MFKVNNDSPGNFFDFAPDRKTITKSAINSVLIRVIMRLKGFITLPILTALMAPEEMGVFNLIAVSANVILPLFTMNLPDGTLIYFAQEKEANKIRTMYLTVLNSVCIWTFFMSLLALTGLLIFRPDLLVLSVWVAMIIYSEIFYKLSLTLLVIYQKTGIMLKNVFIRDIGVAVLTILLVWAGLSYRGLVLAGFIGFMIAGLFLYRAIFKRISYAFKIAKLYIKPFLKISLPLLPVFFFSWIVRSSDSYFLVLLKGEAVVGKYHVVYGLANMIMIFTYALNIFWFPVSARLWKENREKYQKVYVPVFAGFASLLFLTVLLYEFNARIIMKVLVRRPSYHEAYVIMGIIAFAFTMQVLITVLTAPLYSNKNPIAILLSYVTGGLLNALLNFLLIPAYGFVGAAVATGVSYFVIVMIMSVLNYKIAKFPFLDKRLLYIVPSFLLLWAGIAIVRNQLEVTHVLICDVVLVAGVALLLYFKAMKRDEREYLISFIKGLKLKDIALTKNG